MLAPRAADAARRAGGRDPASWSTARPAFRPIVDPLAARHRARRRAISSPRTSPPCCRTSPTRDVSPVPARIDPPLALLRRADASLSARLPLLLQPGEPRARRGRAFRAGLAPRARRGGRARACCRCISPAASRWRGAIFGTRSARRTGLASTATSSPSGTLGGARDRGLAAAGLKHVQLSFQDFSADNGDRIAGLVRRA